MRAIIAEILPDRFSVPEPYDVWIEYNWWEKRIDLPYVVMVNAELRRYQSAFRTLFMARRYARRIAKRIRKASRAR